MIWSDRALPELQADRDWFDRTRAAEYKRFERTSVIIRHARHAMTVAQSRSTIPKMIRWMG